MKKVKRIIRKMKSKELTPVAILLTHAHFDHIGAVDSVRDRFNIPVYIHEEEQEWLSDPTLNGSAKYPGLPRVQNWKADHLIKEEGLMTVGPFEFEVRHTPGHSPGSVSFIFGRCSFCDCRRYTISNKVLAELIYRVGIRMFYSASIHDKLLDAG